MLKDILSILSVKERRNWVLLLLVMCISALMDAMGIASVTPFLAILAKPSLIESSELVRRVYDAGRFKSIDTFLVALGAASFIVLIVSAGTRLLTLYAQNKFTGRCRHRLSCRLLEGYLAQPYEFFLNRHTGDMGRNILSEVDQFVDRVLSPLASLISAGFVLIAMGAVLILIDPFSALVVTAVLCGAYCIIFVTVRPALSRMGKERLEANRTRFEIATEALGGIKTLKILDRENQYVERFRKPSHLLARNLALSNVIGMAPKFAVETIGFGGILVLALTLMVRSGGSSGAGSSLVIPILALYALAGYRMLPAVQTIYLSVTQLKFAQPSVSAMRRELTLCGCREGLAQLHAHPLPFARTLALDKVSYHYPGSNAAGLKDVSFTLPRGSSLGIVGSTGSGKTTFIDVLLGLLEPQSGNVLVDGIPIGPANRPEWRMNIGYVPQEIFLTDSTIAENIAFGLDRNEIDMTRVRASAKMARIDEFVVTHLPQGYDTHVGERGVRLSGGQRQRIGIARALYRDPEVIIFDEATSALDNLTESEVMEAISATTGMRTAIIVAHRLTTVRGCSQILMLDNGRVSGIGTWTELSSSSSRFRAMSQIGEEHEG